jgi:hypothetical protein
MQTLTHKLLLDTLRLGDDGQFYYKVRRGPMAEGSLAGTFTKDGCCQISLYGHTLSIQRLRFFYENGYIPTTPVYSGRHKRAAPARGKLKLKGVSSVKSGKGVRYIAQKNHHYIGCYATKEEASVAYIEYVTSLTSDNNKELNETWPIPTPSLSLHSMIT